MPDVGEAVVEGEVPEVPGFSGNGLVAVVPGGAVIRTGTAEGTVKVVLRVSEHPPPLDTRPWDEVVEVSWHVAEGMASVTGPGAPGSRQLCQAGPPRPGEYRLRAHARGRDEAGEGNEAGPEEYELAVWPAPAAPQTVHKRGDRLGHRLRGEPEPADYVRTLLLPALLALSVASHLVRTDFTSDTAWEQVREQAQARYHAEGEPYPFAASLVPVSDAGFDGASWQAVKDAVPAQGFAAAVLFIADSVTLSSSEHPILVIDLSGSSGTPMFRCIPSELWSVENNLNLGNMSWRDFADAADGHGIFRGFP